MPLLFGSTFLGNHSPDHASSRTQKKGCHHVYSAAVKASVHSQSNEYKEQKIQDSYCQTPYKPPYFGCFSDHDPSYQSRCDVDSNNACRYCLLPQIKLIQQKGQPHKEHSCYNVRNQKCL